MSRTILTIIGVIVGVCAIVVMISLGIAVNRATDDMLQNWGDLTRIEVMRWNAQAGTPDLDEKMVEQLRMIPDVVAVTPLYQTWEFWGQVTAGRSGHYVNEGPSLIGVIPDAMEHMGYDLLSGSWDINGTIGRNKIPVLVGEQVIFSFRDSRRSWNDPNSMIFPEWDETWTTITNLPQYDENGVLLNPENFFFDIMNTTLTYRMQISTDESSGEPIFRDYELVPVGVVSGGMSDWTISNGIIMSLENMRFLEAEFRRASGSQGGGSGGGIWVSPGFPGGGGDGTTTVEGFDTVFVKVNEVRNVAAVETSIRQIGYQIFSMSEIRDQMQGQVAQTQLMLGGLAAVSLFVAALNIMNTMTMAITERTREIGVMKVLGCRLRDIRNMFLIESGAIGFLGGAVGVGVSFLLSLLLNNITNIMYALGIDSDFDLLGFFGLSGLAEQMPDMALSVIPAWLVLLALAFAVGVGFVSGISPANRAMRISSLEAIRHE